MHETLYLSSMESRALESVRACTIVVFGRFDTGKSFAVATLDPPIPNSAFGSVGDITQVVLAVRHEGDDVADIKSFPCFVHVAVPKEGGMPEGNSVSAAGLRTLAWAELYRSADDAAAHRFDTDP